MILAADARDLVVERYHDRSALVLARHAAACYDDADGYGRICDEGGWDRWQSVETGATQAAVASSPWAIVASVRGTHQWADVREDVLSAWRRPAAQVLGDSRIPGSIGWGFARQAIRIWPDLSYWLEREMRRHPDAPVYWSAHSLGAAVAPQLMELARRHFGRRAATGGYLFETPRCGDIDFARWWDARHPHVRSVAHALDGVVDIVTRLPPRWTGARHVCRDQLTVLRGSTRQRTTRGVAGWRLLTRLHRSIRAHGTGPLIATLERRVAS